MRKLIIISGIIFLIVASVIVYYNNERVMINRTFRHAESVYDALNDKRVVKFYIQLQELDNKFIYQEYSEKEFIIYNGNEYLLFNKGKLLKSENLDFSTAIPTFYNSNEKFDYQSLFSDDVEAFYNSDPSEMVLVDDSKCPTIKYEDEKVINVLENCDGVYTLTTTKSEVTRILEFSLIKEVIKKTEVVQ